MMTAEKPNDEMRIAERIDNGAGFIIENLEYEPPHEYTVYVDSDDRPEQCSCPGHKFHNAFCKHMQWLDHELNTDN